MMIETDWLRFKEGGRHYRIRAEYGMDYDFARRHNQNPHFSVTGTIDELRDGRWEDYSGGMLHDEVARHFPQLEPYLKWHLVAWPSGPMHYFDNAKYWWQKMAGVSEWPPQAGEPDPAEAFASAVALGALPDDAMPPAHPGAWLEVLVWLNNRLPALRDAFRADMEALGVMEPVGA